MASSQNVTTENANGEIKPASKKHPNVRVLEGLLDKAKSKKKKKSILRARHVAILASFAILVALPTSFASFYMAFIAEPQYESSSSFTIRSIDSAAVAGDILGMFSQSGATNTVSDSYITSDYILSEEMVRKIDEKFDLNNLYAVRGGDIYYGMDENIPIEEKLAYWRGVASVDYDHASNILKLRIKAFDPHEAQEVASFVLASSEALINDLSDASREEALKSARTEVERAEQRLAAARLAIHDFRNRSQDVDPVEGAKLAVQLIAEMEQRLVQLNSDLATARNQMADDTPRVRVIKAQISSLEEQIAQERRRLGSGSDVSEESLNAQSTPLMDQSVSSRLQIFEKLETEREFSQQAYTAAMASLEKARMDASGKQRYLATFIEPTLSEAAQYPRRVLNVLLVFIGGFFLWGMLTLGYYNLRDRA